MWVGGAVIPLILLANLDTTSVDSLLQSAKNVLRQGLSKEDHQKAHVNYDLEGLDLQLACSPGTPAPLLLTIQLERLSSPPSFLNKLKDLLTAEVPSQAVGDTLHLVLPKHGTPTCSLGIGASPQTLSEFYWWSQRMRLFIKHQGSPR